MSERANSPGSIDLRQIAAATAVVIGMVAAAALAYLLLDILLLLFIGIVVAAALQPWHVMLCRWGVPKGLAVLLIYLFLIIGLVLIALVVGPVLIEQIGTFVAEVPGTYARARSYLQASATAPFHFLGQRLPPFERLTQTLTELAPQLYQGTLGVTTSIVKLPAYFVTVLAIGFYWTMEVPRFERLLLSLLAVERRPRALYIWHEIESKLGGFMRGQGLAMLTMGAASALGYALIGLPNVLALAVLAGLLEAVPMIGPALAVVPAVFVALPLGLHTVIFVIGLAVLLQLIESNLLIPRIMYHAVGVSALVAPVGCPRLRHPIRHPRRPHRDSDDRRHPGAARYHGGQRGARRAARWPRRQSMGRSSRPCPGTPATGPRPLRARTSRMGIDSATADHVVDAADQQIEVAVARVEEIISVAQQTAQPLATDERAAIVERLQGATGEIEQAVERVDTIVEAAEDALGTSVLTVHAGAGRTA